MKENIFINIAEDKFNFLIQEFECSLIDCNKSKNEIHYKNETTYVKIKFEYQISFIFIMLYKLEDGRFIDNPKNITKNSTLYGYTLDDIIGLQNKNSIIKPAYEYGNNSLYVKSEFGFKLYISKFANNLKNYGKDILNGKFSMFYDLEKIVKNRLP